MNTIILHPSDTLFFKDGRPMEGSLSGHGMSWPTPDLLNHAICAALHRAGAGIKQQAHKHAASSNNNGKQRTEERSKIFGSLTSAGAFPVHIDPEGKETWYFPRPLDLALETTQICYQPDATMDDAATHSSLPSPLRYPVANMQAPSKENPAPQWIPLQAYENYINQNQEEQLAGKNNTDIGDFEHHIGIGIDPETGTTGTENTKGHIYSASYLRLRDEWRLGAFAKTEEKSQDPKTRIDLIPQLIRDNGTILIGGQQKTCTATCRKDKQLPLPTGITQFTATRVKWILLSPALWPQVGEHTGGWLPSWVDQSTGEVHLREKPERKSEETRDAYRKRIAKLKPIGAKLVAALVEKPIIITGWAVGGEGEEAPQAGAKSTHLAAPAGSIYYFECDSPQAATQLAKLLNWHSQSDNTISNRRSNLLGEKGFGIGICSTW